MEEIHSQHLSAHAQKLVSNLTITGAPPQNQQNFREGRALVEALHLLLRAHTFRSLKYVDILCTNFKEINIYQIQMSKNRALSSGAFSSSCEASSKSVPFIKHKRRRTRAPCQENPFFNGSLKTMDFLQISYLYGSLPNSQIGKLSTPLGKPAEPGSVSAMSSDTCCKRPQRIPRFMDLRTFPVVHSVSKPPCFRSPLLGGFFPPVT